MLVLVLGLTMCLVLMLGIAIASPANTARAEETDLHIPVSSITATSNYEVEKTTTVAITDELVPVTDLVKVFNETAQEPTFGGTLVRDTDFEVSYAVKAGSTDMLDFSGKPVFAGTYIVTVTGKGAYEGSFTKEFVINKAAQRVVPEGLIANPISCREGSGTIDGVTTAMEYRKVGDADYTKCTSSKITGLAAGEYQIRYAGNENYLASADVTVTIAISHNLGTLIEETPATCIADGMKAHYYCSDCGKYFDESKKETTEAALTIPTTNNHTYGELIPEVPATADKTGTKKHFECSVCGKLFDENKNEVTAADLVIPKIGTHNVVINGESKFYKEGESVTVTAEDKEGKEFVGWKDASGNIVSTKKEYTFEVKDEMVLTAVYQDKAPGGGTIDGEIAPAPDKNGLSGGQIAGIVIGSVAGVGIVGFAIFWFVVKKKTFAELISAIKALFNKKQ